MRLAGLVGAAMLLLGCGVPSEEPPGEDNPESGCAPGELPEGPSCLKPGIEVCAAGFEADGLGGCQPRLPSEGCASGSLALPGDAACHPVGDCDAPMPSDGSIVHVDATNMGEADGSSARPWRSLSDAIANAPAGAVLALRPGTYQESVVLAGKPLVLQGACPERVAIAGIDGPTIEVGPGADGSVIRNLAITGIDGSGVSVEGATGVQLEDVWIHDTPLAGLIVGPMEPSEVSVVRSLFERTKGGGVVHATAQTLRFEESAVRDVVRSDVGISMGVVAFPAASLFVRGAVFGPNLDVGIGVNCAHATVEASVINVVGHPDDFSSGGIVTGGCVEGLPTSLAVSASVIQNAIGYGVVSFGAATTIETTTIRDVHANVGRGHGILVQPDFGAPSSVTLKQSLVERTAKSGVLVRGGTLEAERIIVRESHRHPEPSFGPGLMVVPTVTGSTAQARVRGAAFEHNRSGGIIVYGSDANIQHVLVGETEDIAGVGWGIAALYAVDQQLPSQLYLGDATVRASVSLGIYVQGSSAEVMRAAVTDTRLSGGDGTELGEGIAVASRIAEPGVPRAQLQLFDSSIARNGRAGVTNFGANVLFGGNDIVCNAIALSGVSDLEGDHNGYSFDDRGGNACGCGDVTTACEVIAGSLRDIVPPAQAP